MNISVLLDVVIATFSSFTSFQFNSIWRIINLKKEIPLKIFNVIYVNSLQLRVSILNLGCNHGGV